MTDPKAIKTSLYAAVGAGDAVVQAVADVVAQVRERAETRQTEVNDRIAELQGELNESVETLRTRLVGLPTELPEEIADLRERFSPEELRRVAEAYLKVASDLYTALAERGEETVERLRKQPGVEEGIGRAEAAFGDAVELTEDALGNVARQTRAVGEQAVKLAGLAAGRISDTAEEVGDAISDAGDDAALKLLDAADEVEARSNEAAQSVDEAKNQVADAAKKAPAKKTAPPAKKATPVAKKTAPAKKPAPRKTTGN